MTVTTGIAGQVNHKNNRRKTVGRSALSSLGISGRGRPGVADLVPVAAQVKGPTPIIPFPFNAIPTVAVSFHLGSHHACHPHYDTGRERSVLAWCSFEHVVNSVGVVYPRGMVSCIALHSVGAAVGRFSVVGEPNTRIRSAAPFDNCVTPESVPAPGSRGQSPRPWTRG